MCGLAQHCYTTYGVSRLRDILNAGVDAHYWFAGVFTGLYKADDLRLEPEYIEKMSAMLEEKIDKPTRNLAKIFNFGLPGSLSARVLYKQMRMAGLTASLTEVERIRQQWFDAFPEMEFHMKPARMSAGEIARYSNLSYRVSDDGSEELDDTPSMRSLVYTATNLSGRKRNRCSYTSALNYVFQSLVADGAKHALWNMYKLGMGPYLQNFVHDEVDYILPEDRVRDLVPKIEEVLISGMKKVIPDVTVRVETTINRHWDKSGVVFPEATYDDTGRIIVPECAYVEALRNPDKSGAEQPQ